MMLLITDSTTKRVCSFRYAAHVIIRATSVLMHGVEMMRASKEKQKVRFNDMKRILIPIDNGRYASSSLFADGAVDVLQE